MLDGSVAAGGRRPVLPDSSAHPASPSTPAMETQMTQDPHDPHPSEDTGAQPLDHVAAQATAEQLENILDFDAFMSAARRTTRTVPMCTDPDLDDAYNRACEELAEMVTPTGEIIAQGERSVADTARAQELDQLIQDLRERRKAATSYVVFEAMPEDEWDAFQEQHRDRTGQVKNAKDYTNQLISRSLTKPALTPDQVKQLRGTVSAGEIDKLAKAALEVNESEGLDVPKLPSYLPSQSSRGSSPS